MAIESMQDWRDRALTQRLFLYDYIVLTERTAVMRDPTYAVDDRIGAIVERFSGSRNWWAPIRNNMLEFAGLPRKANGVMEKESQLVITYIIRQGRGRGLDVMSHRRITEMLKNLEEDYGWEVNILNFDRIPKLDQIKVAGRSTVGFFFNGPRSCRMTNRAAGVDPHGCPRQRSNEPHLDATRDSEYRHRAVLPWRLQPRLYGSRAYVGD